MTTLVITKNLQQFWSEMSCLDREQVSKFQPHEGIIEMISGDVFVFVRRESSLRAYRDCEAVFVGEMPEWWTEHSSKLLEMATMK